VGKTSSWWECAIEEAVNLMVARKQRERETGRGCGQIYLSRACPQ
jgi:hypothetical protein